MYVYKVLLIMDGWVDGWMDGWITPHNRLKPFFLAGDITKHAYRKKKTSYPIQLQADNTY